MLRMQVTLTRILKTSKEANFLKLETGLGSLPAVDIIYQTFKVLTQERNIDGSNNTSNKLTNICNMQHRFPSPRRSGACTHSILPGQAFLHRQSPAPAPETLSLINPRFSLNSTPLHSTSFPNISFVDLPVDQSWPPNKLPSPTPHRHYFGSLLMWMWMWTWTERDEVG